MSTLDKEQVLAQFTQAYTATNGKAPSIEAKGGWYSVDGGKNVRLAALQEMTESLKDEVSQAPETPKAAKKATKPAKTKPAEKSAAGFSVKAYWAEQILSQNAGSKLPR